MDKNAIKKFAVWARTELIARVSLKGVEYGITEDNIEDANADSVGGKVLTAGEKKQRQALIAEIKDKGYKQVMEEVAYTWFNRFSALRFMEVNGYLPSHVRVFTDEENSFKPQIITEAIHLELDGLNMEKVYELKEAEKTEELYKYLLIVQCNALNKILPGMFQKISDYTELLLPDNLLRDDSVIQQMIELIPEEDWKDAVQIIGWLYQYYNSEKKDNVFAALKKNVKITKENIPAATQLFTPDWIVRYMVENSLGRLWLEGHPDAKNQLLPTEEEQSAYVSGNRDPEDTKWHYYLEEAEQEPEVQAQLAEIRKEYAALTPEQLKVIDPCSGSGHILAYMFDVLMKIYESYGYTTREAVASIVENNIYGLDIDDRAAQLAYFAVMMKARQYDRRFFSRGIQPHVYAIVESNHADKFAVEYFCNGNAKLKEAMDIIISELHDAKEYGSLLNISSQDWGMLNDRINEIVEDINISRDVVLKEIMPMIQVAEILSQKYDSVVTNPPYMGISNCNAKMNAFLKKEYFAAKNDLFSAFIERTSKYAKRHGLAGIIAQNSWMFLSRFENMRVNFLSENSIVNLIHLGVRAFEEIGGEAVQTATFVFFPLNISDYLAEYIREVDINSSSEKEKIYLQIVEKQCGNFFYKASKRIFELLPGSPVAYWIPMQAVKPFQKGKIMDISVSASQNVTGNNDLYLREFWEVSAQRIGVGKKWIFYAKGGGFRKWYGNLQEIVDWSESARTNYQKGHGSQIIPEEYWYKKGITWGLTSQASLGVLPDGSTYDKQGSSIFITNMEYYDIVLALLNCCVADYYLQVLNPSLSYQVRDIRNIPLDYSSLAKEDIKEKATLCVRYAKDDWNSFETSWDFQHHPLLREVPTISEAFDQWQAECNDLFDQLKANEEELNHIFIDIYGLQDELTPEVEDKDVTVRKAELGRDIRSFISYAVGCMFGRYSLYNEGLLYAGGAGGDFGSLVEKIQDSLHTQGKSCFPENEFYPDRNNIIPICDDEYFEDDIVDLFVEFVKTVYGEETLDENLKFIADALGGKGQPKDVIRNYFLNDFYADHCKIYQKRPIYWLFDSGKKNGFKALIYMHRYQPDIIARIRTDYVHEQQARYRTAIADLEQRIANASTGERVKLNKKLTVLQAQDTEIRTYEEKIHHLADQMISIDLDDGVKKNYAIFQDVLAKIK